MLACGEVLRWTKAGYCHRATTAELSDIKQGGRVSPALVITAARKSRLFIDYTVVNECLEDRTFRMDQLSDLAPSLRRDYCLFKAKIQDAYYHLRLRKEDQIYLAFSLAGVVYVPACLNYGLAVTLVLHKGDAPGDFIPSGARPPSVLLLGRLLRGRRNYAERPPGDGGRHQKGGSRHKSAFQSARLDASPHEKPVRRLLCIGNPWDPCRHPTRAVSSLSGEVAKSGESCAEPSLECLSEPTTRPRALPPDFCRPGKLHRPSRRRRQT
jgi:hypothetical protein